jgi:protein arginine N-methyltransferase 1
MKNYICRSQFEMFPQRGHFSKLGAHQTMLADRERVELFRRAIFKTVKKGDVVIDIGTGTGIMAIFAAQAGAKKIYAIESSPIIKLARKIAEDNDLSKKICFIGKNSWEIKSSEIKERADVIISETVGFLGVDEGIIKTMDNIKRKFGKKSVVLIPNKLSLFFSPVSLLRDDDNISFWKEKKYGINFSRLSELAENNIYIRKTFSPKEFLSKEKKLLQFNLMGRNKNSFKGKAEFKINKKVYLNGFAGWFMVDLGGKTYLSTAPRKSVLHWKQCFLSVSKIFIKKGQSLILNLEILEKKNNIIFKWSILIPKIPSYSSRHSTNKFLNYSR